MCPGLANNIRCCFPNGGGMHGPANPAVEEPEVPSANNNNGIPAFKKLWANYPGGEADEVKKHIGGGINADYITNTCTIRISRALNMGGYPLALPFTLKNGEKMVTVSGAKGERYAIRVAEFREYALKMFGKPSLIHSNGKADGGPQPSDWANAKGLVMFDVKVWTDATGHFDLWNGPENKCAHECYWNKCREAWLWKWE
jgi:hypothetical protein